jgi:uncharacterized protein YdhG (YjbR/CyaY superfamily)
LKNTISFFNETICKIILKPEETMVMNQKENIPKNIDEYIAGFQLDIQKKLNEIRITIRKAAPQAEEAIRYSMPTFILHGNLVHFAAMKNHIGFYPTPTGIEKFKKELSIYKRGKGSIQFPLKDPVPLDLIAKIVKFRVRENLERAAAKAEIKK